MSAALEAKRFATGHDRQLSIQATAKALGASRAPIRDPETNEVLGVSYRVNGTVVEDFENTGRARVTQSISAVNVNNAVFTRGSDYVRIEGILYETIGDIMSDPKKGKVVVRNTGAVAFRYSDEKRTT